MMSASRLGHISVRILFMNPYGQLYVCKPPTIRGRARRPRGLFTVTRENKIGQATVSIEVLSLAISFFGRGFVYRRIENQV